MLNANMPAFTGPTDKGYTDGLTKREYMATAFMAAMLANPKITAGGDISHPEVRQRLAEKAWRSADALHDELARNPTINQG